MAAHIEGRSRELLEEPNFCFVATLGRTGRPHVVPVWVGVEGDLITLNSAKGRTWPTNAERDPRVTLTVPNGENMYEYLSVRGRVVEITTEGADAHIDALAKKYLGQDSYPFRTSTEQRIILRVEPERVRRWGS